MNFHNQRIIAYREGSFDAFIASFIYWTFFKNALNQTYVSVDPFTDKFLTQITESNFPDFVISIGANITGLKTSPMSSEKGLRVASNRTSLYVFENSPSFTAAEDLIDASASQGDQNLGVAHKYYYDQTASLAKLMFDSLSSEGVVNPKSRGYNALIQGLRINESPDEFIPRQHLDMLASLFPQMRVSDFPRLYKLLFEPVQFLNRFQQRSIHDIRTDEYKSLQDSARKTSVTVEFGKPLKLINTTEYAHPLFTHETFSSGDEPVFLYCAMPQGIRGRLFVSPKVKLDYSALDFFPEMKEMKIYGDKLVADVLLPHSMLSRFYSTIISE